MSIRPVDMQVPVQRSADMAKIPQNENVRPETQQHYSAVQLRKETQMLEQNVIAANKSENETIDENARGNGGASSKKRNKRENRDNRDKKEQKASEKSDLFDVSI